MNKNKYIFISLTRSIVPMIIVFIFDILVNNPLGFYTRWWWFDIPMHIVGGIVTTFCAYSFFKRIKKSISLEPFALRCFVFIGSTAIVGILWEIYEFFASLATGIVMQPSVADTVGDLANDLIGATLFCVLLFLSKKRNNN